MLQKRKRVFLGLILFICIFLFALFQIPKFIRNKEESERQWCLSYQRQIYSAVIAQALAHGTCLGESIPTSSVVVCIKGGRIPQCPSGGSYTIPLVGGLPSCSRHGALLEKTGEMKESGNEWLETIYRETLKKGKLTDVPMEVVRSLPSKMREELETAKRSVTVPTHGDQQ